ncbi:formate/nitrite transporter family protein [Methyloligella sp. 2.7D]|uniref:formate/nitrite transporter family protein n=1 Tax=unclassified Methyloligella TaxID=2625955 RepID=UPI00157C1EB6|nr:formate/nitrite transporter family protein [Methyloligella sp. GL2]QKP77066.1 formate/nitrite transporter family protein [Methyloligella sp. GL2]
MNKKTNEDGPTKQEGLSREEVKSVKTRRRLRAAVVYEIIRTEGEGELARAFSALWWSGVAAGISIGFSVLSQAMLMAFLSDSPGSNIIADLGYSVGFLIVILSRQQLFTENTLTAVLPVISRRSWSWFWVLVRLWGIVLAANLVGCLLVAAFLAYSNALTPEIAAATVRIGEHLMANTPTEMFVKGIVSGWLIAALVWMLPSAEGTEIFVITLITYLIALGGFTHVIAGSVEAFYMVMTGHTGMLQAVFGFFIPTLLGNVAGGTILFAVLSYAQVRDEV